MDAPLIVTSRAARRLRLLQVPPPAATAAAASPGPDGSLPAALLAEPVALPAPSASNTSSWQHERDVLAEVAATVPTLQALQLPAGTIVEVANADRPDAPTRLARLLALPPGAAERSLSDGVAYLAPSLAFNLGLALHLAPLLHGDEPGAAGSDAGSSKGGSGALQAGNRVAARVLLRRHASPAAEDAAGQQQQQQQQEWHRLAQPGSEPALVPVAREVHILIVRTPQAAVLQQRRPDPQQQHAEALDEEAAAAASAAGEEPEAAAGPEGRGAGAAASDDAVAALQHWFLAGPRVVCAGDVLAVPKRRGSAGGSSPAQLRAQLLPSLHAAQQSVDGEQQSSSSGTAPLELLFFKVALLVLPDSAQQQQQQQASASRPACVAAAVDVGSTTVKLVGSCSSALPVGLPHYLAAAAAAAGDASSGQAPSSAGSSSGGDDVPSSSSPHPSGSLQLGAHPAATQAPEPSLFPAGPLLPSWRPLAQLLATTLHPGTAGAPLRLAVLLHGPAGCGKSTAADAAAAAVGCRVVSLSSHDVKAAAGAAERHTFEGLRAAFAAAAEYAPSLLVLRQLSVLGDASSHGGSGSSSAHSYAARLGSVLTDCIRAHGPSAASSGISHQQPQQQQQQGQDSAAPPSSPAGPVILVACTASAEDVPAPLRRCFTHELAVEAPDQQQRLALLHGSLGGVPAGPDWAAGDGQAGQAEPEGAQAAASAASPPAAAAVDREGLEETALHTAGLLPRELRAVAADAAAAAALQALPPAAVLSGAGKEVASNGAERPEAEDGAAAVSDGPSPAAPALLSQEHLAAAVDAVRQRTATDIGAPKIPSVRWEDVGGLHDIKRAILDTVELPLKHPELFAGGLRRRSGVLLYGPPGTGKTLLAKAVATECSISFLSVKGPELINMYVGESERQIREVFARARRARPCVVFFDELDSLAPARGRGSDSGGVMDRVVSQLLAEIDGVQGGGAGDVFIVGATNRPDLLDTALLRPGRLDRLLYVGIASDVPSRLQVLQALTRRFRLAPGVDLAEVAAACGDRFTGADLYALCSDAWMTALKRRIAALEERQQQQENGPNGKLGGTPDGQAEEEGVVEVTHADFLAAAESLQPSLSAEEVAKYERIRDQYAAQAGPASSRR